LTQILAWKPGGHYICITGQLPLGSHIPVDVYSWKSRFEDSTRGWIGFTKQRNVMTRSQQPKLYSTYS
jgi:hypothetical protein